MPKESVGRCVEKRTRDKGRHRVIIPTAKHTARWPRHSMRRMYIVTPSHRLAPYVLASGARQGLGGASEPTPPHRDSPPPPPPRRPAARPGCCTIHAHRDARELHPNGPLQARGVLVTATAGTACCNSQRAGDRSWPRNDMPIRARQPARSRCRQA